jgi:ABC-type transport system involved in multi-copper enzyme maturation permease subunit
MRFPRPDQISIALKIKTPTIIWFTLRQLLFSRLNIGVILLVIIPIITAGLVVTDAFREQDRYEDFDSEANRFEPEDENYYYLEGQHTANVEIDSNQFEYKYYDNSFNWNLGGTTSGDIDYLEVKIIYYIDLGDYDQIIETFNSISGDPDDNIEFGREPDLFINSDYTSEDQSNWTDVTQRLNANALGFNFIESQTFKIRLGRDNALPFIFSISSDEENMVQFGTFNLSAGQTPSGWDWSEWSLNLEFGKLNFIMVANASSGFFEDFDPSVLKELENRRLMWPNQLTIYIDAFNSTDQNVKKIGQSYAATNVNKRVQLQTGVTFEEDEEEGHIIYLTDINPIYFVFINPIIILLFTSVAISGDTENRTATYFTSRPISKMNILMSKYLSANIAIWLMILPSMIITYFIMSGYKEGIDNSFEHIRIIGVMCGLTIFASVLYSAFFTLYSSWFKFPLIFGIIYIFVFEMILANMAFTINRVTYGYHLNTIAYHALEKYDAIYVYKPAAAFDSAMTIVVMIIIYLAIANIFFAEKDVH